MGMGTAPFPDPSPIGRGLGMGTPPPQTQLPRRLRRLDNSRLRRSTLAPKRKSWIRQCHTVISFVPNFQKTRRI